MISFLTGTIVHTSKDSIVLETSGGVGYEVRMVSAKALQYRIGQQVQLHTYLRVGEGIMDLYGFETLEEREFFILLLSVSGVGPKSAMHVLAIGSIDDIKSAIARGDVKYLTAVQGVGKKTAERMVVELKSKISAQGGSASGGVVSGSMLSDVIDGLTGMGYTVEEAREAAKEVEVGDKTAEQVLREVLKRLTR